MTLGLFEESGTIFRDTSLPAASLSFSEFGMHSFEVFFVRNLQDPTSGTALAVGEATSLSFSNVTSSPEPSTIALLTLGVLGLARCHGLFRRHSRT
jgi:hypothetical protein